MKAGFMFKQKSMKLKSLILQIYINNAYILARTFEE